MLKDAPVSRPEKQCVGLVVLAAAKEGRTEAGEVISTD